MTIKGDTAVVGVGVLGKHLCRMILEESTTSSVMGVTKTRSNHDAIRQDIGHGDRFQLITSEESCAKRFDNVVFCAPPSGFADYPQAIQTAIERLWAGPDKGVFVFTSSGAVYGPTGDKNEGGVVTEASQIDEASGSPRISRLVNAERVCLDAGGCCLRLAGLYDLQRGAHNYWLTNGKVSGSPDGIINLLHYVDAAAACLAALRAGTSVCQSKPFLISDGHPMSRYVICESALKAKVYHGFSMPLFEGDEQPWALGKIYDGTMSNKLLNWSPQYKSFDVYMEANA